jgi:glycosyltransferase involved in cell wall biosynthesis
MSGTLPTFSIIIPTFNRPRHLAECLRSLASLDYPRDSFEVIVVDDGSPSAPEGVAACFKDQIDLTLLRQPNAGPATARNTGAARARGEFLAFTDDDCAPAPNWLRSLAARFVALPDSAIGGRTLNALPNNLYSTASQMLIDYLYAYYNADPQRARFVASNNLAMPAERFLAIGGFNTTFKRSASEDRDLCDHWLHRGRSMVYAPEALVYHAHHLTLRSFWRQHFNYGRGAFCFHRVRSVRCGQARPPTEPAAFYLNLLRHAFFPARSERALWLASLIGLSQVAHTAGYFYERLVQARGTAIGERRAL